MPSEKLPVFKVCGTMGRANMFSYCPAVSAEEAIIDFRLRNPGVTNVMVKVTLTQEELAA